MRFLSKCVVRALAAVTAAIALATAASPELVARTPADEASVKLATEIFKQLIEINTTDSVGSSTVAAEAMAQRLRDAGFQAEDIVVMGTNPHKGNMIARLHGTGAHKPVLLIVHYLYCAIVYIPPSHDVRS